MANGYLFLSNITATDGTLVHLYEELNASRWYVQHHAPEESKQENYAKTCDIFLKYSGNGTGDESVDSA
jgi:hypothetical protein